MKWSDIPFQPTQRVLRQFAVAWLLIFLGWAAIQGWALDQPRFGLVLAVVAVGIGIPGCIRPALVRWLYVVLMVLVFPLGWLISLLLFALIYFGLFMPIALLFRLRGRDILRRKKPREAGASSDAGASVAGERGSSGSYWQPKQTPLDVRRYFRQY